MVRLKGNTGIGTLMTKEVVKGCPVMNHHMMAVRIMLIKIASHCKSLLLELRRCPGVFHPVADLLSHIPVQGQVMSKTGN